jgi:hypothetical protein
MHLERLTRELIAADHWRMECLAAVRSLNLQDGFIAAGFVRNLVWDHLHGYEHRTPLNDVDVVFFNRADKSSETERFVEEWLQLSYPEANWQVRNQARMHLHNGHAPYSSTAEAIAHFPEMATCVGIRLNARDQLEICAPHGLEQIWELKLSPNHKSGYPMSVFHDRVRKKQWLERWPNLDVDWNHEFA